MKFIERHPWLRWLILAFIIGLSVGLFLLRDRVRQLEAFGYPGIFLVSLLSNASLFLPVPGVVVTTLMGAVFNPFWVALAAGSGATLGELSGYLAGYSGSAVIENRAWYDRFMGWMQKYGGVTILVMAFVPNPLFDAAGMAAGALKMPVWRFLIWCLLGKIGKMLLFAYGGAIFSNLLQF